MSGVLLLPLLLAALWAPLPARGGTIKVGYLAAFKGNQEKLGLTISGAMSLAVKRVNEREDLLPGHTLEFYFNDTGGQTRLGTRRLVDMICNDTVAIFGPEDSCFIEAHVAASYDMPMISYKCADDAVSDKEKFPTFARTYPQQTQVSKSVVALLQHYGWHKFSIIAIETYADDSGQGPERKVADSLEQLAINNNMTVNHKEVLPDQSDCCQRRQPCCDYDILPDAIKRTKDGTRIYVLLGPSQTVPEMLFTMSLFNMLDGSYMVIYIDLDYVTSNKTVFKYMWPAHKMWELLDGQDYQCQQSDVHPLDSLLVVLATPPHEHYDEFREQVRQHNRLPPFNIKQPDWWTFKKHIGVFATYLYDSVIMYAEALNRTINANTNLTLDQVVRKGSEIVGNICNHTFESVTGSRFKIDENGDSEGNFTVLAMLPGCNKTLTYTTNQTLSCGYCMKTVGQFYLDLGKSLPDFKMDAGKTINWLHGIPPTDEPACGFDGMICVSSNDSREITAGVLGIVALVVFVVMSCFYRVWKEEQEIMGLLWKIAPDALDVVDTCVNTCDSKQSITSIASFESRGFGQIFTLRGRYRKNIVRVQTLNFSKKVEISRLVMKEMRTMRELRHQNVNPFLGSVVEPTNVKIVSDYCTRGSLPDILEGGDLNLEYMFIAELIRDLVKGMLYLHSSALGVHGNLKSSNCVVTSRWALKVTDFGLRDLRATADLDCESNYQFYKSQLWKSPELLRSAESPPCERSSDVYAFGIILHEIMCRDGPFGGSLESSIEPKQIVARVKQERVAGDEPFRPPLHSLQSPPDMPTESERLVTDCMKQCWQEAEASRPNFWEINKMLQPLRAGLSANLVNQMMEKMEKYANNLEDLVRDRTQLLNEEKQKTEALLYRMLPESVASDLTRGIPVQPETFDSVTIYFSDIVGFTKISAESKPLQVVELLNDLYTLFDDIIRGYDVYKVETIGDAYMVVSGVPKPNGIMHAGEIASMALSLVDAIQQHTIQHRPGEKLKLRIGIHTGQVVAGVVGLTMPRYCLFGDTVNTASRIESTGEPLRIHISDQCQRTLAQIGGYHTVSRGPVPMKGKGLVETHWLVGAETVRRPRPDLPALPPLFTRGGGGAVCRPEPPGPPGSASHLSRLSLSSLRTRGSVSSRPTSRPVSRAASRPPSPPRRRLAVPRVCQRPASLPSVRESRSLDNFPRALRLPMRSQPRRRDSRSVADCRELLAREQEAAACGSESVEPMLNSHLLRSRLDAELEPLELRGETGDLRTGSERAEDALSAPEEPDTDEEEERPPEEDTEEDEPEEQYPQSVRGDQQPVVSELPSDAAPTWDCVKDWFRRFFNRHRLEPGIPLNGKLKHNGYSLHSSQDTVV